MEIYVEIYAYDNDYDFFLPEDRTPGGGIHTVEILAGPVATPIEPLPNTFTACNNQVIYIRLIDPLGIDVNTIELLINGNLFTITDDELEYLDDSLLVFTP